MPTHSLIYQLTSFLISSSGKNEAVRLVCQTQNQVSSTQITCLQCSIKPSSHPHCTKVYRNSSRISAIKCSSDELPLVHFLEASLIYCNYNVTSWMHTGSSCNRDLCGAHHITKFAQSYALVCRPQSTLPNYFHNLGPLIKQRVK